MKTLLDSFLKRPTRAVRRSRESTGDQLAASGLLGLLPKHEQAKLRRIGLEPVAVIDLPVSQLQM